MLAAGKMWSRAPQRGALPEATASIDAVFDTLTAKLRDLNEAEQHEDSADRFLAATAAVYELTLVTADDRMLNSSGWSVLPNR